MSSVRPLALLLLAGALACACSPVAPTALTPLPTSEPDRLTTERVVFLIGDAGETPVEGSPLLSRLTAEVESWSGELASDSAVAVVFLGDNVYPDGVHGPGHEDRMRDSIRLANQIEVLAGPNARANSSFGVFIPGNHDWAGDTDAEGEALLRNQDGIIEGWAARGVQVELMPPALDPGPEVLELGEEVKLVTLDTQWWLSNGGTLRRGQAVQQLVRAVREPAERTVLVAAHHPIRTGGPHGGNIPFFPSLGMRRLVHLMGAHGQDVTALPYQEMIAELRSAFAGTEATVVYASGHEHGLQVIRGTTADDADWMLVSGSGSKTAPMEAIDGSRFHSSANGFMRLLVGTDGGLLLEVVAETAEGYPTVWSERIR